MSRPNDVGAQTRTAGAGPDRFVTTISAEPTAIQQATSAKPGSVYWQTCMGDNGGKEDNSGNDDVVQCQDDVQTSTN